MIYGYLKSLNRLFGFVSPMIKRKRNEFFRKHDQMDFFDIPIFIISFNRLTYLKTLIDRLKEMGYSNINIIDNDSSYQPLLDYYGTVDCKVFRMADNYGHMVFWDCDEFKEYRDDLYIVTDPDIIPDEKCPNDFAEVFYGYLKKYPRAKKVGFSLKIDDIPEDAPLYRDVVEWEQQFNTYKIPFTNAFAADIDTTLALYIPDKIDASRRFLTAIRTGAPYQARHLPWYQKKDEVTEEQMYYAEQRSNGFWDEADGKRTGEGM